jgi:hypothetical protein
MRSIEVQLIKMNNYFGATLILTLSVAIVLAAQVSVADIIWDHQFGTALEENATGMGVDSSSNVYVVGWTIGVLPGQSALGDIDAFIAKYNSNGTLGWTRQFGTTKGDQATDVVVAEDGSIYVVGSTGGTFPGQTSSGHSFIRKYNSSGDALWTRQFGTSSEQPLGVNTDSAGAIYIVGRITGFFPGQETYLDTDAFITKYDSSGNQLWSNQFGTPDEDAAWDVLADTATDRVYVVGYTYGEFPDQTNQGYGDGFLSAFDIAGDMIWTSQFGTAHLDVAKSVALSADNRIYVAGQLNGGFVAKFDVNGDMFWLRPFWGYANRMALEKDTGNLLISGATRYGGIPGQIEVGGQDAFVIKCDSEANEIITWQFGTGGADSTDDITIGPNGSVYVIGNVNGALPGETHLGGTDPFVMRLSSIPALKQTLPNGINWAIQLGTNSDEAAYAIGVDDYDNVYVAGKIYGQFPGYDNSFLGGGWDAFVSKWSSDGKRRWALQFGTDMGTIVYDMAVEKEGTHYVVGSTGGTLPGETNSGAPDAFLRKYDSNGNELWTRQFGTAHHDEAFAVNLDDFNNIYVGWVNSYSWHTYMHKFDTEGTILWSKQLADITEPVDFAIDSQNNIYLAGITDSALPGQTHLGGQTDAYVRKYDSLGNEIWTRQFGSSQEDHVLTVDVDGLFNVYVAGRTDGAFPGKTFEGPPFDAFVRKYNSSGNEVWTDQFGAEGDLMDEIQGIATDGAGNVYVTGASGPDALVRKYNKNGDGVWSRQLGGGLFSDYAQSLSLTSNGKLLAAGFTYGSFLDQNYFGSILMMDAHTNNGISIAPSLYLLLSE